MKNSLLLANLILLIVSAPVWAKRNPPRPFIMRDAVYLNGAQIPAGAYQLTWEAHGSNARVTLWKDGLFVATAPGVWAKNGVKYAEDEALLRVNSDGTKSLIEFRIAGAARAIVFTQAEVPARYASIRP
jgi:hypothetical protein